MRVPAAHRDTRHRVREWLNDACVSPARAADQAFTSTTDYRERDFADIGDMELDPFARRYILQGF